MGSKSNVSAFFRLRFRNGFGTKPAGVLLFRMRVRNTFFLNLAWWLAGFQVLRCAVPCLRQPFATFFSLFLVGSKNNVSALFWLRFRMVWALYFFLFWAHYTSFFLVGSKSDVSAFFWLRLGNGFGTKPAGALLFRMRSRCAPDAAAVSQWLRHKTCWGSAFSHARPKHLFSEFGLVACRLPSFTLRCALLEATFRNLFSLFLVGSKSNVSEVFWLLGTTLLSF